MNDVYVYWIYGAMVALFGGYALYLARLRRRLEEDE